MRRAQNADTHALKQPWLSQNISLSVPVLYFMDMVIASEMQLESESEMRGYLVYVLIVKYLPIF